MDVEARNLTASISADRKNLDDALYNYRSWCTSTDRSSDIELSSIESRLILYLTYRVETSVHKNGDGQIVCMTWPELKGCTINMRSVVYDNLATARHDRKTTKMTVIDWALKIHLFDLITYYPVVYTAETFRTEPSVEEVNQDSIRDEFDEFIGRMLWLKQEARHEGFMNELFDPLDCDATEGQRERAANRLVLKRRAETWKAQLIVNTADHKGAEGSASCRAKTENRFNTSIKDQATTILCYMLNKGLHHTSILTNRIANHPVISQTFSRCCSESEMQSYEPALEDRKQ